MCVFLSCEPPEVCFLAVVELGGHPGESPLEISEHKLERFGPLLLRVELGLDGVGTATSTRVLDLPLLHVHPKHTHTLH